MNRTRTLAPEALSNRHPRRIPSDERLERKAPTEVVRVRLPGPRGRRAAAEAAAASRFDALTRDVCADVWRVLLARSEVVVRTTMTQPERPIERELHKQYRMCEFTVLYSMKACCTFPLADHEYNLGVILEYVISSTPTIQSISQLQKSGCKRVAGGSEWTTVYSQRTHAARACSKNMQQEYAKGVRKTCKARGRVAGRIQVFVVHEIPRPPSLVQGMFESEDCRKGNHTSGRRKRWRLGDKRWRLGDSSVTHCGANDSSRCLVPPDNRQVCWTR